MTQDQLKQNLRYENGGFVWITSNNHRIKLGNIAGTNSNGYRQIQIDGKVYYEHRLVWLWHHGYLPTTQIDHINRDKTDNRIENLREATDLENHQNKGKFKNNTSGTTGVHQMKNGKWMARICVNRKIIHLGYFDTQHQAIESRKSAELTYHPLKTK
jgi:hypothetical protein